MEKMTPEKKDFCEKVCAYCALNVSHDNLPKMQMKIKNDERYAVLYQPYNDGKNIFSYIFYFEDKSEKVAFICTQKEKILSEKVFTIPTILSKTLSIVKNGKQVWSKTQDDPLEIKTNMLHAFMGDLSMSTKVSEEDKIMLAHTLMEGMKMVSKSRRMEKWQKDAKLSKEIEMLNAKEQEQNNGVNRKFLIGRTI